MFPLRLTSGVAALILGWTAFTGCGGESTEPLCESGDVRAAGDDCNLCVCDDGAWECTMFDCVEVVCAPPQVVSEVCPPARSWFRDPETGACCAYESYCAAPPEYSFIGSEAACETIETPECEPGASIPAGDGCDECVCNETGTSWDCTRRECAGPAGKACGFFQGGCPAGEYCAFDPAEACSSGDAPSVCRPVPAECTDEEGTVCGCNGQTYLNRCVAGQAGTGIRDVGECEEFREPRFCGEDVEPCLDDEYCAFVPENECGAGGIMSSCEMRPELCSNQVHLVCGCDGKTYGNACHAAQAGTGVRSEAACP
jgi:hypothetical protein